MLIFIIAFLRGGGGGGEHMLTQRSHLLLNSLSATRMKVASGLIVSCLQFYMVSIKLKGNFFSGAAYFKCTKPLCVTPLAALQHCNLEFPRGSCEILMEALLLWLPAPH